jgi:hypothetical protein
LKECHDGPLAGHGGAKRTTTFLKKSYYWPNLKDNVEEYVKTCLTCQQNQTLNKKQAGLLHPLPIPEGSWENVSMDFMVSLPRSFRPQTDGQTERVNLVIQQFIRNYVAADQQDWVDHLKLTEFCYNSEHFATRSTPFQMVTSKSPIVPMTWAAQGQPSSDASEEVPMVTQLDEERKWLWELAKAHKRYKDFADKSR